MGSPGYTTDDLIYYGGVIAGLSGTALLLRPLGVHPLIYLGGGLAVGVGLGWFALRLYKSFERSGDPFGDDREDGPDKSQPF